MIEEGGSKKITFQTLVSFLRSYQILLIGITFLVVASVLNENVRGGWELSIFWRPQTWITLLQEGGFALIIAFLISEGIERAAKRDLQATFEMQLESIQRQVFRSTYGRNVPTALIDEVELLVLRADFMRHEHRLTYNLETMQASALAPGVAEVPDITVVVAEVNMSYEVENISSRPMPYTVRLVLELPPFESLYDFVKWHSIGIDDRVLDATAIAKTVQLTTPGYKEFSEPIGVVQPGQRVKVKGTWQAIKCLDDVELWRCLLPSDGMTLCVRFPKEAKVMGANALHASDIAERTNGHGHYHEWAIEKAVLPHQGIVFWWRCSNPPVVAIEQ